MPLLHAFVSSLGLIHGTREVVRQTFTNASASLSAKRILKEHVDIFATNFNGIHIFEGALERCESLTNSPPASGSVYHYTLLDGAFHFADLRRSIGGVLLRSNF